MSDWEHVGIEDDLDWEMWSIAVESTRFGRCKLLVWVDCDKMFMCSATGSDGIEQSSGDLRASDMEEAKGTALVWAALAK